MLLYIVVLTLAVWLTYIYTLKCGFVSDDLPGLVEYDGKLQGLEYGMISRWVRYHLCGGNFPSVYKAPNGNPIPQGKVPFRHHLLSILLFNTAVVLGFLFLSPVIGTKLAFLSLLLFSVHPICSQGIAWISAIGYPLCLIWMFVILNLLQLFYASPHHISTWVLAMGVFVVLDFLAINALFVALCLPAILVFMGYYPFAVIASIMSVILGLDIVKKTINLRAGEFKKQNMGKSTFLKPRKLIVALKTFCYYVTMVIFPKRIGLYHKWGYHYDETIEREDWRALFGLIFLVIASIAFFIGSLPVKLGILWFTAFISIFLNLITIQQFVTERYAMIPTLGVCIVTAYLLQDYLLIYSFLLGIFIMRTWVHLPTYHNEIEFYQSNVFNFPNSEVAFGNLGVSELRAGRVGSAIDSWATSIKINPEYDVPHYNMYSHYKANAEFQVKHGNYVQALELYKSSLPYIQKTVECKVCHFKETWAKERDEIKKFCENPLEFIKIEKERLVKLKLELQDKLSKAEEKDKPPILSSIQDIEKLIIHASKNLLENHENTESRISASGLEKAVNPTPDQEHKAS